MATFTPNYGLHQWVPEDQFLRTDFNEDFQKIDAAIKAAENKAASGDEQVSTAVQAAQNTADRALASLEPLSYNVYNLLLRNYYEGKSTQYKKALLFDGFRDQSGISSITGLKWDSSTRSLLLDAVGQGDYSYGYSTGYSSSLQRGQSVSFQWTATGNGTLTGVSPCIIGQARLGISSGGVSLASYEMTSVCTSWPTIPFNLAITAGTTYDFMITNIGPDRMGYCSYSSSIPIGYQLLITPVTTGSGTMTSTTFSTETTAQRAVAWVRHLNGSPSLSLQLGGSWFSMSRTSTRSTVNLDGTACKESAFVLNRSIDASLAIRLSVSTSAGVSVRIYDYGVILL